ncbi:MAG: sugar kinase [Spartobacteria bacterium]|nr:sugar kinase [Spartobacteria bacterium]
MSNPVQLTIVGSIGIDTVETPLDKRVDILGGSASFACIAASYFTQTGMVGVVGTDFPEKYRSCYIDAGIDIEGLQVEEGQTFRWSGVYEQNMDVRRTLSTELNVFEHFSPEMPAAYINSPYLLLGNISPELQLHVLNQIADPQFVMADTMDLWINISRPKLVELIERVTMLTINESEARKLTEEHSLVKAAREIMRMGPQYVLIKKGEHGSMLFSGEHICLLPAFPLGDVVDPTGAGDTFAGALMGALAAGGKADEAGLRQAMIYGTVVASFGVQDFSVDRLLALTKEEIESRATLYRSMLC